jgi:hypothetical protein
MNTPHVRNIADACLTEEIALPAAPGVVQSAGVDMGSGPHVAGAELRVQAPELDATELPDTETVTYDLEESTDNIVFTALATVGTQTGAAGAGAAAADFRFAPVSTGPQFYRVVATSSAGAGDQSAKTAAVQVVV